MRCDQNLLCTYMKFSKNTLKILKSKYDEKSPKSTKELSHSVLTGIVAIRITTDFQENPRSQERMLWCVLRPET